MTPPEVRPRSFQRRWMRWLMAAELVIIVLGIDFVARHPEAHGSALEIFQRKPGTSHS